MPAPKAKPKPRPAGHTFPGRKAVTFSLSELAPERLRYLCERQAAREAELGRPVNPRRLGSFVVEMLINRAYFDEQKRDNANAEAAGEGE